MGLEGDGVKVFSPLTGGGAMGKSSLFLGAVNREKLGDRLTPTVPTETLSPGLC